MAPNVAVAVPDVATMAYCKVELVVPDEMLAPIKLTAVPDVSIAGLIPDSLASGQPSPSESKS